MTDSNSPSVSAMGAVSASPMESTRTKAIGYVRWMICGLLLFGTTKNYMDRQILGLLKPHLQQEFGWTEIDYGNLVLAFQMAYAIGMVLVGRLVDRFGTRIGYAISVTFWSLAAMSTALCNSLAGFAAARFALGLGEAGVFPASIKAVAEWFPRKERSFAVGIFNAGTNLGAIITPFIVPFILSAYGWRISFVATGAFSFILLGLWLWYYRVPEEHPNVSPTELAYIKSDPQGAPVKVPWMTLLPHRQTWTFVAGKFFIDPVWWLYLFWTPDFLHRRFDLSVAQVALPIMVIYIISDLGSVAGGWLSSLLLKRGRSVNFARKATMFACAVCVVPVVYAAYTDNMWVAVAVIGIAAAAHQGFSANLFTLTSDLFPSRTVASVVGIGGMAGAIGGMFSATIVGHVLQATGSYVVPFVIAGATYLTALTVIHLLSPRLEPAAIVGVAE